MDAEYYIENEKLIASTNATRYLASHAWELENASELQANEFAATQASLDRSLKLGEMEIAANLQAQLNVLQAESLDIQREQYEMDWVMSLVSNPVTLYMLSNAGLLGTINNLGNGQVGSAVEKVLAAIPEGQLSNIQDVNARSAFANEIDSFNISVKRGMAPEAYQNYIRGTAPFMRGAESRLAAGAPTDYSQFFPGPTTAADIQGPDIQTDAYAPQALGSVEQMQARGRDILAQTGAALDADSDSVFDTSEAYRMALGIEGDPEVFDSPIISREDRALSEGAGEQLEVSQAYDEGSEMQSRWEKAKRAFPDMNLATFNFFAHIPDLSERTAEWINTMLGEQSARAYKESVQGKEVRTVRDKRNRTDAWYDKYDPNRTTLKESEAARQA